MIKNTLHVRRLNVIRSNTRNQTFANPNKFSVQFNQPYKNVIYVKLISADIPKTDFNVNESNNGFVLTDDGTDYPIELPIGDYDSAKLITELTTSLNALGATNAYTVGIDNGMLSVEGTGGVLPFMLKFSSPAQFADEYVNSNGGTNTEIMYNQSARIIMGFNIADYTSVGGPIGIITSPNKIDLSGENNVYICIKTDGYSEFNYLDSINQNINDCFYLVPLQSSSNTISFFTNNYDHSNIFESPLKKVQKIFIELRTEKNRLYNTRGVDWGMAIEFGLEECCETYVLNNKY